MKVYRTKVEVSYPGYSTESYIKPTINLFPGYLCDIEEEIKFENEVKFLYCSNRPGVDIDNIKTKITYKTVDFHPLRDIINRLRTLFGFGI